MPVIAGRETAAAAAYRQVKAAILDGRHAPGAMLSEGAVAAELSMSRTPVREAFARLQSDGLLRVYPKRGALVVEAGPDERADLLDARELLESHGVQVAVSTGRIGELVSALSAEATAQQAALDDGDHERLVRADVAFHALILAACGNRLLTDFSVGIRERHERMSDQSFWLRQELAQTAIDQHRDLIAAIADEDVDAFTRLLRSHLERIHDRARVAG